MRADPEISKKSSFILLFAAILASSLVVVNNISPLVVSSASFVYEITLPVIDLGEFAEIRRVLIVGMESSAFHIGASLLVTFEILRGYSNIKQKEFRRLVTSFLSSNREPYVYHEISRFDNRIKIIDSREDINQLNVNEFENIEDIQFSFDEGSRTMLLKANDEFYVIRGDKIDDFDIEEVAE